MTASTRTRDTIDQLRRDAATDLLRLHTAASLTLIRGAIAELAEAEAEGEGDERSVEAAIVSANAEVTTP